MVTSLKTKSSSKVNTAIQGRGHYLPFSLKARKATAGLTLLLLNFDGIIR